MAWTTQRGRLLAIDTPFENDFLLIQKIRVSEGISKLFEIDLELLHEENEPNYASFEINPFEILGEVVTIRVSQKDGVERYFNGIVQQFSQGGRDTRFSKYSAKVVPAIWKLTQNFQSRIFQQMTVPEILRKIFEGFQVVFELRETYEPRNYCVQYRESDFDFASRLMEEEGIYYYFEHLPGNHLLIIADSPLSHRQCCKDSIPFYVKLSGKEGWEGSIGGWWADYRFQTGKVALWDYNFQLPHKNLSAEMPSRFPISDNQQLEIYDFPAGYARKYDGIDKTGGEQPEELLKIFRDKQRTIKNRVEQIDSQYKTIRGISDCAALSAGLRFTLYNHPNKSANGEYVVTEIIHEAIQSPSYISEDEVEGAYSNAFVCMPYGSGHPPFRPPRVTPKPVIYGSQTAYVVGPAGEEIFTDKYGRVKVQFHWDREGQDNEASSCWLRVAQTWAGNKWGTMFIPRVGMEVIVDFLEGDPDQPIITGCVYNPVAMPPYALPDEKTKSTIKSNSSKGGGGFNEIRFEDKKGEEQIFIHAQKRMDVRVRGSFYETCGGSKHEIIGRKQNDQSRGNLIITVSGNYDLHVKESVHIQIDQDLNESIKKNSIHEVRGDKQTFIKGKNELNAKEITFEALSKISLKVGGSFITIDLSGITISGPMVKINSGGAAMGTTNASINDPLDAEPADTGEPGNLNKRRGAAPLKRTSRALNGYHAPPFAVTTLSNGDLRVGNSIVIKRDQNDPNFQNKVIEDLTIMSNYPTGMNTLNTLNNSGQTVTIRRISNGGNSYEPTNVEDALPAGTSLNGINGTGRGSGGTVRYNPDNPVTNRIRPRDVGLHHELVHAVHAARGEFDITTPDSNQPNNPHMEETNTIRVDNDYRRERGVHLRKDHTTL